MLHPSAVRHLTLICALCLLAGALPSPRWAAAVSASARGAAILSGPQPFVTLFCQFPNIPENIGLPAHYEGLLGSTAPGLADYWAEVSYGQISLAGSRLTRWYLMPHPSGAYPLLNITQATLRRLAEDCTAAADAEVFFPDYVGINLVFNLWKDTAYGGRLVLPRDGRETSYGVTWLSLGGFSCQSAIAHEMGHAFGLNHSSNARGEVHRNFWDVMSAWDSGLKHPRYGHIAQHPIAYHKDQLGWIPATRKFVAQPGKPSQVTLERLARPTAEGYLMVEIPVPRARGSFYTVEARRRVGYDRSLPRDGVIIHRVDPAREPAIVLVGDAWTPGMVFADPTSGVSVEVLRATATGYVVVISTDLPH